MLFDFATISAKDRYKLLVSTVVPRPIAWIVSQDWTVELNAAPFSFFNAFAGDPPVVGIGIGSHDRPAEGHTAQYPRHQAVRGQSRFGRKRRSHEYHSDRVRAGYQRTRQAGLTAVPVLTSSRRALPKARYRWNASYCKSWNWDRKVDLFLDACWQCTCARISSSTRPSIISTRPN